MTKIAKNAAPAAPIAPFKRKLRSKGPLNSTETDIVVYAGLSNGEITATPLDIQVKNRAVPYLLTDQPTMAAAIAHKIRIEANEQADLLLQANRLTSGLADRPIAEREAAVAGSLELIDIALRDAFRVLLFTTDAKPEVPAEFKDWKASKPDTRTSPAVITLVRC